MHSIAWWPTVTVMVIAIFTDLRSRRIPNWLVFPFLIAGVVVSTAAGGWSGLGNSIMGIVVAASLMGVLYVLDGTGMGDVKLCAGIGAWVWTHQLLFALAFMGLIGGLMALGWALRGGFVRESLTGTRDLLVSLGTRGLRPHPTLALSNPSSRGMPYAPAIAVGAILSFFAG